MNSGDNPNPPKNSGILFSQVEYVRLVVHFGIWQNYHCASTMSGKSLGVAKTFQDDTHCIFHFMNSGGNPNPT